LVVSARIWQNLGHTFDVPAVKKPEKILLHLSAVVAMDPGAWNWSLIILMDSSADLLTVLRNGCPSVYGIVDKNKS